jgi:hypothetical protein
MIETQFGRMDLADANILEIHRSDQEIRIEFNSVRFWQSPIDINRLVRIAREVTITLANVREEQATYYVGEGVAKPHPDPRHPLDSIEVAEFQNGGLSLQGYRNGEPWYVWDIASESISVGDVVFYPMAI